jgi:hypothetical protein
MRNLQSNENTVLRMPGVPEGVKLEVERLLQDYITYRLESRPRSLGFLERLRVESMRAEDIGL